VLEVVAKHLDRYEIDLKSLPEQFAASWSAA